MVSGPVLNGTNTPAGWASYFMENPTSMPGSPTGPLPSPPVRCSYLRELLVETGGFDEVCRAGEDTAVNHQLWGEGHTCYADPDVSFVHRSPCRTPRSLIRHHYRRGEALAQILRGELGQRGWRPPAARFGFVLAYLPRRFRTIARGVRLADEQVGRRFRDRRVRVLVVAGVLAAWAGLVVGLLRVGPSRG